MSVILNHLIVMGFHLIIHESTYQSLTRPPTALHKGLLLCLDGAHSVRTIKTTILVKNAEIKIRITVHCERRLVALTELKGLKC